MKKLRYSTGVKAAVVIVQQILLVVLVVSILLVTTLFQKNILDFGDLKNKSFTTSAYFFSLFQESTAEILDFAEMRRKFESDGSYDGKRIIDIREYYNSQGRMNEISPDGAAEDDGNARRYYLEDLVEWARSYSMAEYQFTSSYSAANGIYQKQSVTRDGVSVFNQEKSIESLGDMSAELQTIIVSRAERSYGGVYNISSFSGGGQFEADNGSVTIEPEEAAYEEAKTQEQSQEQNQEQLDGIIQRVIAGELYELNSEELGLLLEDMGMSQGTYTNMYSFVNEAYNSVDGKGIWTDFIQGNCTEVQMQKSYEALEYTLENIGQEVNNYKKCLNLYNLGKEGSNVSYWIKKGNDGVVYTNLEEEEIDDLIQYGKEKGMYFFYREADMRLETNVKGMEDVFYDGLEQVYGGKGNILFICVDTSFPQEDSFYEAKQEYSRMYPWIYIGTVIMVISGLGCLICFIYLSTVAGKNGENGEITLCWFDKIPTELAFIGAAVVTIAGIVMYGEVFYRFNASELAGLLIMSGVLTFFSAAFLMLFYLSFIRRVRAGVLWSGSLTHWILKGVGAVFQLRKPATKMIIWFGLHLVACAVLMFFMVSWSRSDQIAGVVGFVILSLVEGVMLIREGLERNKVLEGIHNISGGDLEFKIEAEALKGDNKKLAEAVNTIGEGLFHAVDDSMKNERLKADLITNVSHDIKTPLTSIINYVDLLKREDIPNERAQNYLAVLEQKSQRLKQLTEDLLEASKISSGNITLQMERINFVELVYQTGGEFNEKFEAKGLTAVTKMPREPVIIMADGRRIWRVVENLYNNVAKYAMANTRVYVDMVTEGDMVSLSIKNISQNALNIQADELTERFIRGDVSRSTEGSGLGLSIAKNLTNLMGGEFEIYLDGDLFKVTISFVREPARVEAASEQKEELGKEGKEVRK